MEGQKIVVVVFADGSGIRGEYAAIAGLLDRWPVLHYDPVPVQSLAHGDRPGETLLVRAINPAHVAMVTERIDR